ncbi:MAG: hypothetical protein IIT46_09195 [Lachnospiraceae bacterium]|nr:hypothetical protein [Lachnospiraceae bacterium]MBQ5559939.1 hypothetical protein [Lachnospiraceae bacterium]MCR4801525.1 hypothetical protein [Lachnospiraceae bacterium]
MKKKLIIGSILIILAVALVPLLFHPVWFMPGENIVCSRSKYYDKEFLEGLKDDEDMIVNEDILKNGLPSEKSEDYRQLGVEFCVCDTSFLKLKSMSVVAKSIDCENSKNVMYRFMWGYDEGGFEELRFGKDSYETPFMLVYVGDLDSEEEIQERMEDIVEHTVFDITYSVQGLGEKHTEWKPKDKVEGYVVKNVGEWEE